MTVSLKANFFQNARGLTFLDANGVVWSLNPNTNSLSASFSGGASGANPTAKVGLLVVNGSATTFMRSDAAPPIDQTIAPTWTGAHKFIPTAGTAITVTVSSGNYAQTWADASHTVGVFLGDGGSQWGFGTVTNDPLSLFVDGTTVLSLTPAGAAQVTGGLGLHGNSAPAQSTGWGTPTGAVVEASLAGGTASLATVSAALAEIITVLKAIGILGA